MRVLIADDDPVSLRSLRGLMQSWGYDVATAENGTAALNALAATHYGVPIALVTGDQVTAEEAREQCGPRLTDGRLRQWKRRKKVEAQRVGRGNYYLLDDLLTAKRDTERTMATSPVRPAAMLLASV